MAGSRDNQSRQMQNMRKTGRRMTMMIIPLVNIVMLIILLTPLRDLIDWFFTSLIGEQWVLIGKVFIGTLLLCANGVAWWAAKFGD